MQNLAAGRSRAAVLLNDVPTPFERAVRAVDAALIAMASGNSAPFKACWADSPDTTLMGAFGTIERGREDIDAALDWVAHRFAGGTLHPNYDLIHVSGNLGYTVALEQGHTHIDGNDDTVLLIRVTHIYRYTDNSSWKIIHRHADHPPTLTETPRLTSHETSTDDGNA